MSADFTPERTPLDVLPAMTPDWDGLLPPGRLSALHEHPLLRALSQGQTDLPMLRNLLVQHQLYSRHFTAYLCLVIARLPRLDDVLHLMHNLLDELGADREDATSHSELFLASMHAIGAVPDSRAPLSGTRALTAAMFAHCRQPDPLAGLAALCLGAEAIVPVLYSPIVDAMRHLELPGYSRYFFELHVAEDQDHAIAMRDIITRLIDGDPARAARVRNIATDMINHRIHFLDDVWSTTLGLNAAAD